MSGQAEAEQSTGSDSTSGATAASGPLSTLEKYWSDIREHTFSQAYEYLAPGAAAGLSKAQFVQSEEKAGIQGAQFEGEVVHEEGGTSAEVRVTSLVTHDTEFGCREWTGVYGLAREHNEWLIVHAAITPHSC